MQVANMSIPHAPQGAKLTPKKCQYLAQHDKPIGNLLTAIVIYCVSGSKHFINICYAYIRNVIVFTFHDKSKFLIYIFTDK